MTGARLQDLIPDAIFESEELLKHLKQFLDDTSPPEVASFLASNFIGLPLLADSFMHFCLASIKSLDETFSHNTGSNSSFNSITAFQENIAAEICPSLFSRPFDSSKADKNLHDSLVRHLCLQNKCP